MVYRQPPIKKNNVEASGGWSQYLTPLNSYSMVCGGEGGRQSNAPV